MNGMVRRAGAWVVWWLALFWLWFLLVGEWNRVELVAAACAAAIAATIGEAAWSRANVHPQVPLEWLWRAKNVPAMIFVDFGIVVWALVKSALQRKVVHGAFRSHEFPVGGDARSTGTRAWVSILATYSPNAYVVELEPERQLALLHDLVPLRSSEKPA